MSDERTGPRLRLPDTPYWTIPGVERIVVRDLSRVRLDHEAKVLAARYVRDNTPLPHPAVEVEVVTPPPGQPSAPYRRYRPAFRSFLRLLWSLN